MVSMRFLGGVLLLFREWFTGVTYVCSDWRRRGKRLFFRNLIIGFIIHSVTHSIIQSIDDTIRYDDTTGYDETRRRMK